MSASSRHKPSISDDTAERGSPDYTNSTPVLHSVPVSDTVELATHTDRSGHQLLAYRPLDVNRKEIRLLSLQPSADDRATLQFTFSSAYLESDVPSYEALSYVWGEPDFVVPILVDDQHTNITQHLAEILTFLRSEDAPRILWIDAICINQSDNAERAQQVQIMKEVFSSCRQALAWVGPTIPAYPEEWADDFVKTTQASLAHSRGSPDLVASGENFAWRSENRTQAYWRTMIKDCTAPPHVRRLSDVEIEQLHHVHVRSLIRWDGNWTYYTLAPDGVRQYVYSHHRYFRTDEVTRASSLNLHILSYRETGGMFATTVNGLFVNTRRHVAPGDVVAVLDGGKLPVILRKVSSCAEKEESQQLYHFVAPAYVHGIMDGEVEEAISKGWLLKQDILLA